MTTVNVAAASVFPQKSSSRGRPREHRLPVGQPIWLAKMSPMTMLVSSGKPRPREPQHHEGKRTRRGHPSPEEGVGRRRGLRSHDEREDERAEQAHDRRQARQELRRDLGELDAVDGRHSAGSRGRLGLCGDGLGDGCAHVDARRSSAGERDGESSPPGVPVRAKNRDSSAVVSSSSRRTAIPARPSAIT